MKNRHIPGQLAGSLWAPGIITLLMSHGVAPAAVTFVGSIQNDAASQISAWSSTSVAKTLDLDGNNFYGTDGYTWMNTDDSSGTAKTVLYSSSQSAPSYTSGIAYTGAGTGVSGSYVAADDRLLPDGTGSANVGYAGPNYNLTTGATTLQQMFAYTMNRDMEIGETIRLGVVLDSFNDRSLIGTDSLRIVAGAAIADATIGAWNRTGVMDLYFFDITGLTSGQQIQIWGAKAVNLSQYGYNAITISGVTFDSVPEPSASLAVGLGALMMGSHRRRSRQ